MSFQLTAEQKELRDSVRGFLSEELSSEYLRKRIRDEHSTDIGLWKKLCDLGLFTYFAELPAEGGGSFSDLAMLAYEAGRSLLPETAVDAIFAGAYMKRLITAKSESSAVLAALDPSRERIAIAPYRADNTLDRIGSSDSKFSGSFEHVPGADASKYCVIMAPDLKSVYLVDIQKCKVTSENALDGTVKTHHVSFENQILSQLHLDPSILRAGLDILKASECAGISSRAIEITCEYLKTRKQFGVPVGGFQAVQHAIADAYLQSEALDSLSRFAAWAYEGDAGQVRLSSAAAIAFATENAPEVIETAIQLHGGIGFTWEYDMHLFLRRARSISALYARKSADYRAIVEMAVGSPQ